MHPPALVLPFHDPTGLYFRHLEAITPQLKGLFARAFVSLSPATGQAQPQRVDRLARDDFFALNFDADGSQAGDHYRSAYRNAVDTCPPDQILHLCDIDKLAFALQSSYREQFLQDLQAAGAQAQRLFLKSCFLGHPALNPPFIPPLGAQFSAQWGDSGG